MIKQTHNNKYLHTHNALHFVKKIIKRKESKNWKEPQPLCHRRTATASNRPAPRIWRSARPETPAPARLPRPGPGTPPTRTPPQSAGGWSCWPRRTAQHTSSSQRTGARPGNFWGEAFCIRKKWKENFRGRRKVIFKSFSGWLWVNEATEQQPPAPKLCSQLWRNSRCNIRCVFRTPLAKVLFKLRQMIPKGSAPRAGFLCG